MMRLIGQRFINRMSVRDGVVGRRILTDGPIVCLAMGCRRQEATNYVNCAVYMTVNVMCLLVNVILYVTTMC